MRVIDPGHRYQLATLDGEVNAELVFVKRLVVPGRTDAHPGVTCQEVIRALIDRVKFLDAEAPHRVNEQIIKNLRAAFVLFEARALERKVSKGLLNPEEVAVNPHDGHFEINTEIEGESNDQV